MLDKKRTNYIGMLQEACVRKNLHHPRYQYESVGSKSNPTWLATVQVGEWVKTIPAPTKKMAKNLAAYFVLKRIDKII